MIANYFIVGIIIIVVRNVTTQTVCNTTTCCLPIEEDCSFYTRCLEAKVRCGPEGYAIGYGLRYCEESEAHVQSFSPQGQVWLWATMLCLQTQLIGVANNGGMDCEQIRTFAFGTHAYCYVQSGICFIPPTDWVQIFLIIYTDLNDPETWKSMLDVGESCGSLYYAEILTLIDPLLLS